MSAPAASPPLPLRNCYWVTPGLLLAGEHPGAAARDKTRERLKKLLAAGIECFVDLTKPVEMPRYDVLLPFDVEYVRKPIKDHGLPGSRAQMIEILEHVASAMRAGRPVYVHCQAGIGRTGTVIGCLLVERGLAGDGALDELNRLWQQSRRSRSWSFIPETDEQASYVRQWTASLPAGCFELTPTAIPALRSVSEADQALTAATSAAAPKLVRLPGTATAARITPDRRIAPNPASVADARVAPEPASVADPTIAPNPGIASSVDPLLDPATLVAARGLRHRFVGALFGLAVGDAVAAATQYRRPGSFSPVGDMIGGGPFDLPRGAWSDDTAMALCLADSLLERNGFDARDQVQRYARWQEQGYLSCTGQCVGITASTARALAFSKWRRVRFAGSHDPEQLDPEPLSRIAPVVLYFFASPQLLEQQAADSARTTCQAPAVLECCKRLARAIHAALSGQPKRKVLAEIHSGSDPAPTANATAASALAAAGWAFGSTDNFRDAVLRAANVGGNSDVVAAICGQLAGAHYGVTAIPASWRNGLMQKDLIEAYADRLLAHGLLTLAD